MFVNNCRICLSDQTDNATLLFTQQNDIKSPSETGQMYQQCLQLELLSNDHYPEHVCNYCKLQLNVFQNFMMMAKRSYEKFCVQEYVAQILKPKEIIDSTNGMEESDDYSFDDNNKSSLSQMKNGEEEYLDSELDDDDNNTKGDTSNPCDIEISQIGQSSYNSRTGDLEDDKLDDWVECVVEYLDDEDVVACVKNEIIKVEPTDQMSSHDEENGWEEVNSDNDSIMYYSDYEIRVDERKDEKHLDFFELDVLDDDEHETRKLVRNQEKKLRVNRSADDGNAAVLKNYHCRLCNCNFDSNNQLQRHNNDTHPKSKLECDICGKKFKTAIMHQSHMNVHNGLPAFTCEMCDKTFNFLSNYQTHIKLHTNERPYQCKLCDKGFRSKWDLIIHMRVHNDVRKYPCNICGKRFRVSSHLTAHKYTHAQEKLFPCDICHQRYNSPRTLKQHKNTVHSDKFRFYCSQCDKKFKRKHHVISHLKTHYKSSLKNVIEMEDS